MRFLILAVLAMAMLACGHKAETKGSAKHYHVTGRIVSVNPKDQTASIDAAEIPGYMEAMTMDYPIAKKSDFESLHPGDQIEGTLDVYESGDYSISELHKAPTAPGKK